MAGQVLYRYLDTWTNFRNVKFPGYTVGYVNENKYIIRTHK